MFLKVADGRTLGAAVRERALARAAQAEFAYDESALLEQVLSEPNVAGLLEAVWDAEGGSAMFDDLIEAIRQEVIRALGGEKPNTPWSVGPSTRRLANARIGEAGRSDPGSPSKIVEEARKSAARRMAKGRGPTRHERQTEGAKRFSPRR